MKIIKHDVIAYLTYSFPQIIIILFKSSINSSYLDFVGALIHSNGKDNYLHEPHREANSPTLAKAY